MNRSTSLPAWIFSAIALAIAPVGHARPLRVVATVPDLASLVRAVGGEEVSVTVLVRGPQDPHFIEPRPSFVRKLHDADLYLQVGMELEVGWAPVLLRSARNDDIVPGAPGFLDASAAIPPLEVPTGPVDRSMGDVHPYGNPHYLTDPVNGLRVARLIRDKLSELRPESRERFDAGYGAFERALLDALVGAPLVERFGSRALASPLTAGTLTAFLVDQGAMEEPAGWLGLLRQRGPMRAVQDHRLWPYFAARFGIELMGTLEPRPGIAPTTRHLAEVVSRMKTLEVEIVLSSSYFDPRHARWVAERSGARIAEMAHQVGARPGTDDYVSMIDHNVRAVVGNP
jgi:ABC-type Zn uptake system ZnuABC Zn-binding protein ZnuA